MKPRQALKIALDIAMTALLMLLMAYELIGRAAHEWIGASMFALCALHHALNRRWHAAALRGKYTPLRTLQTALALLVLIAMLCSMASALMISRSVFDFLNIRGLRGVGRRLHMLSTYWGFVLMSLHLGVHWAMMLAMARRALPSTSRVRPRVAQAVGACVALYGAHALVCRSIPEYLFLRTEFVFFDYQEPLILFFVDYLAVMGLFVWVGHYCARACKRLGGAKAGRRAAGPPTTKGA